MRQRLIIFGMCVCLALGGGVWHLLLKTSAPVWPKELRGDQTHWVWGRVASLTRHNAHSTRFSFEILGVVLNPSGTDQRPLRKPVKVWVTWPHGRPPDSTVSPGDIWILPLKWRTLVVRTPTSGFDAQRWLQQQGLHGLATVVASTPPHGDARLLSHGQIHLESMRQSVRERVFKVIADPRQASLVVALSLGDQNAVEQDDWQIFRKTGVAHLVSISGLHVTLLASWLAWGVSWLWRRLSWRGASCVLYIPSPLVAESVTLAVALAYALFSGWGVPAQRTVWMMLAAQGLRSLGLSWPAHALWLALVSGTAVLDPEALTQSGFWLSYVAVGVLFLMEPAPESTAWRRWWFDTVLLQWRITLALAPLSLYFFQGTSLAGLWVNLWAIPWVTLVVTPLSLLGILFEPLWVGAGWAAGWLLQGLDVCALTPWALIESASPPMWVVFPATVCAVGAALPGPRAYRWWCLSLVLPLLAWR